MIRFAASALCCVIAMIGPALAGDLDQRQWMRPQYEPAKLTLSEGEALIVVGYSIRDPAMTGQGAEFPVHFGWMPFDAQGKRLGQTMMTTTERCARNQSKACESVQYRLYKIPAGNYALAWTFHGRKLIGLAAFESGGVRFHRNTQEIMAIDWSDNARVLPGLPGFRVAAGEVVYIGNLVLSFKDQKPDYAWSPTREEENVRAIMASSPYADRFTVRQGGYLGGQKRP